MNIYVKKRSILFSGLLIVYICKQVDAFMELPRNEWAVTYTTINIVQQFYIVLILLKVLKIITFQIRIVQFWECI